MKLYANISPISPYFPTQRFNEPLPVQINKDPKQLLDGYIFLINGYESGVNYRYNDLEFFIKDPDNNWKRCLDYRVITRNNHKDIPIDDDGTVLSDKINTEDCLFEINRWINGT